MIDRSVVVTGALSRRALLTAALLSALGARGPVTAQDTTDALVAARTVDPLELGPLVARLGDDAVLERLDPARPLDETLAAIHACRALAAPERALAPLVPIASGRDPDLAPAAAHVLLDLARRLDARVLDAREVAPSALAPAREALVALAGDEGTRPDIRLAATLAADALGALWPAPSAAPAGG